MTSARARRRQRRGRARKVGPRHKSGQLIQKIVNKPPPPNETVMAQRRQLNPGGDPTKAENWPDLCLARGWMTEEQHRAFADYCSLINRSGLGLPHCRTFNPERVKSHDSTFGSAKAQARLRAIWDALTPRRAQILFKATQQWPVFVMWMVKHGFVPSPFNIERDNLFSALDTVDAILRRNPQDVAAA